MALSDGLIAYYKANESSGNSADSIGDKTLTNSNAGFNTGKFGNALDFGTSNTNKKFQYVGSYDIGASDSWSLVWWYYNSDSSKGLQGLLDFCYAGGTKIVTVQRDVSQNSLYTQSGAYNSALQGVSSESTGQWHQIIVTCDAGGNVLWYKDNSYLGAVTNSGTVTRTEALSIGYSSVGPWWGLGRNDEILIYDRVITSDERAELYNSGNGKEISLGNPSAFFQLFN